MAADTTGDETRNPSEGAVRFMSRHLVALTGEYRTFKEEGSLFHRGVFAFSGFVLSMGDRWFWVTAGHCLKDELDGRIKARRMQVSEVAFADYFGPDPCNYNRLPYTYEPDCGFYVYDRDLALDFGLIPLRPLYRQGMEANGVLPICRENWIKQPGLTFDYFKMLGFPSHRIQVTEDETGHITSYMQSAMIAIDRVAPEDIDNPPPGAWFVGRIPADVEIPSIEGMSGGPIYGFRRAEDGKLYYHVVALQSWWRERSRITFGCSLPVFAEAVQTALAKLG